MSEYIDNVLIKLRRVYSKDETVAALSRKLSETEFKVGELTSERDELLHKLGVLESRRDHELNKEIRRDEVYKKIAQERGALKKKVKTQKKYIDLLLSKIHSK
jgi:hypothetical protein